MFPNYCRLLPVFLILFFGAEPPLSAQSAIQVSSAVTTRLPVPNDFCTAPPPETAFLTTDNRVFVVFSFTGGSAGDTGSLEWLDPNGNVYFTSTINRINSVVQCSAYYINIYGFNAANQPGNWRVRLRWGGSEAFSRSFTISTPPSSPLAFVSNTTIDQAVVGASYSFTFQASGGTAPYRWSLSTGNPPPGLALSTAGVLSGTPNKPASYVMALRVTDAAGNSLDRDVALGVSAPSLQIGVGSLAFSFTQGGTAPKNQTFALDSNGAPLSFTVTSDQSWLTATPSSGKTPATITVAVQAQSLRPAAYQAHLTFQSPDSALATYSLSVNLAVLPPGTPGSGGIIRTIAGTDWTFSIPGNQALNAPLGEVDGLTSDTAGNIYAADYDNNLIVRIAPNGTAAVVAGNGIGAYSGDGGSALNASLNGPTSVALDGTGNIYIADTGNHRIRRVSAADGTITTIAGTGSPNFFGDNGPAVNALLNAPGSLALDHSGNLYFNDSGNHRIRRIDAGGIITTVAGNGNAAYSGEGPATTVGVDVTSQMAFDNAGALYFADNQFHVRKLLNGQTVKVAGTGTQGVSGDGGPALSAAIGIVKGLAIDAAGNIFLAQFNDGRIREILPNGNIVRYAGTGINASSGDNGPALQAQLNAVALAASPSGSVYLADIVTRLIRRIDASGTITSIAGNSKYRFSADGTPAINGVFNLPQGVALDQAGNLIVADFFGSRVYRMSAGPNPTLTRIAGKGSPGCCLDGSLATDASLAGPTSIAVDAQNNIYIADAGNGRIRRIGADGKISTVAGGGTAATDGENVPATSALLILPIGIALDSKGNLYIADFGNFVVRRVDTNQKITTFAGTLQKFGPSGDGGPATKALLAGPSGVTVDAAGNVYIADTFNNRIRVVNPNGIISNFAGNGNAGDDGDGGPAGAATLNLPRSTVLDPLTNSLYILESGGNRIRRVDSTRVITTVAGTGAAGFSGDGGPSTAARLNQPFGSMAYLNGTLYFTDTYNNRVRAISSFSGANLPSVTASPSSLSFTAVSNGAATPKTSVTADSSSRGLPVQLLASTNTGGAWLQVDSSSVTTPASFGISADPTGLAAGTYQGVVTVSSPFANPPQSNIAVTFNVKTAAAGHLSTDTAPLSFRVVRGDPPSQSQITINNSGSGSLSFAIAADTSAGGAWLSVSPANGTVSASSPATVTVNIVPGTLSAGVYSGAITLISPDNADAAMTIPVTLLVRDATPNVLVSQSGLTFQAAQAGGNPLPQDVSVLNIGGGVMNWTAKATMFSGTGWLSVSPTSGTVLTPFTGASTVTASVDASSLAPGNYFGQIQIRADGAANSPQTVSVVLNVFPSGTALSPEVRPSALVFVGSQSNPPGSQTVTVGNRGSAALGFNSFKSTASGVSGITNSPVAGVVQPNQPMRMIVQPGFSAQAPAIDSGSINIVFADGSSQTVKLLLITPPGASAASDTGALAPRATGNCSPNELRSQVTNPASNAIGNAREVPLGQPVSLEVNLTDNCGQAVTNATVTVSFSTGEPSVAMHYGGKSAWTGTWQPRSSQPTSMTSYITSFANSPSGKVLTYQESLQFSLGSVAQVPAVKSGGIQNAASYSSAPVVSPGGLIAIYGNQLADTNGQQPPPGPVPTTLGHSQVKLGDALLPLFYTSDRQLNAQVPFNLPVNSQQQLVVQYNDAVSVPATVSVAAAQPAIFTKDLSGTGQGAIVNGVTNVMADRDHPVHAGDVISIYCTGLGPVNPPVPEGVAASTTVLSRTVTVVTATVGGIPATVNFGGLAPGYIGLYQVNVVIPDGIAPGDTVPVVLSEGSQVSQPVTIAVR